LFKSLGYVEKAGGRIEAIVSLDDQVYVVHEGDLFADKYRVLKISPDLVEAVDETTVQAGLKQPTSRVSRELSASPTQDPSSVAKPDAPDQPAVLATATQREQPSAHQSATSAAEPLGYVERADGRVETVVADGDHVRLVPQAPVVIVARRALSSTVPDRASTARVATGKILPPAPSPAQVADASALPVQAQETGLAAAVRAVSFQPGLRGQGPDSVPVRAGGQPSDPPGRGSVEQPASRPESGIPPTGWFASCPTQNPTGPVSVSTVPSILMKAVGFVEKADGELEAILSLNDDVYVVRQGDRFAGRYRALRVSREAVEAVEELPHDGLSPPVLEPPALPDLFSFAIRDGPSPSLPARVRIESRTEQATGPQEVPPVEGAVWASLPPSVREDRRTRRKPAKSPGRERAKAADRPQVSPEPATFVFQALGYVETAQGEVQAIVVDGGHVYLVKEGETFADQYRAVSVDPAMVLAVRAPPEDGGKNSLSSRTRLGTLASNKVFGVLRLPPSGVADLGPIQDKGALGGSGLTDVGVNPSGSSGFAGFDLQSHPMMADNPNVSF
jgi:Tfp pilus assembly protein PilP